MGGWVLTIVLGAAGSLVAAYLWHVGQQWQARRRAKTAPQRAADARLVELREGITSRAEKRQIRRALQFLASETPDAVRRRDVARLEDRWLLAIPDGAPIEQHLQSRLHLATIGLGYAAERARTLKMRSIAKKASDLYDVCKRVQRFTKRLDEPPEELGKELEVRAASVLAALRRPDPSSREELIELWRDFMALPPIKVNDERYL